MKETFELDPTLQELVPVQLTDSMLDRELDRRDSDEGVQGSTLLREVEARYRDLSSRYELLLAEGAGDMAEGALIGVSAASIVEALDLPALVVMRYQDRLTGDDLIQASRLLGSRMVGTVVNAVPQRQLELFQERIVPLLEDRDVPVLGVIPRQRLLGGATVQELADQIHGRFLAGDEQTDAMVETVCIGAMSIDDVLAHFRRKRNKAVVVEGARSNIQLAALETSTRCLILTGNLEPKPGILTRAEERGVSVVLSELSTVETVEAINAAFGRTRFHQPDKLDAFQEALHAHFDFDRLYRELGWETES
jgi:hypothetical protein